MKSAIKQTAAIVQGVVTDIQYGFSEEDSAYWNGMTQWNRLSNVVDRTFVNPASDCSISFGDGENEVGLTNRSVIDGANGLTVLQLGACFIGSSDIDEADTLIANDLSFTPQVGNFFGTTGRSTFVHEFGHLFGFLHESSHSVMRTSPPHLLTGGSEASTVWPSGAFAQGTFDLSFKILASLPNGTYFIYTDMDYLHQVTEILEGDDSTVSAMKIKVNC